MVDAVENDGGFCRAGELGLHAESQPGFRGGSFFKSISSLENMMSFE